MQRFQFGVSWFMSACFHIMSTVILISISVVIFIVTSAYKLLSKLGLAEPDVMCLLGTCVRAALYNHAAVLTRSGLYALHSVSDVALGAGRLGNHRLLR